MGFRSTIGQPYKILLPWQRYLSFKKLKVFLGCGGVEGEREEREEIIAEASHGWFGAVDCIAYSSVPFLFAFSHFFLSYILPTHHSNCF
jgi:hypothetical protein